MDEHSDNRRKKEAVLFTTGRFMDMEEIAKACEIGSVGYIKEQLMELMKEYEQRPSSLHITEQDGRYKLNIKKEYGMLANKLVSTSEFDNPTTKTLALIAYKHPAVQSDVIKARGNKAYDHIKILGENGLVTSEKSGRTRLLKLTQKFYDYFDTADQTVKDVFKNVEDSVKQQVASKAGMTPAEVEEKEKLIDAAEQKEREMQQKTHEHNQQTQNEPSDTESSEKDEKASL